MLGRVLGAAARFVLATAIVSALTIAVARTTSAPAHTRLDAGSPALPETSSGRSEVVVLTTSEGSVFDQTEIAATAGARLTVTYENDSAFIHDVHFFAGSEPSARTLGVTDLQLGPGARDTVSFRVPMRPGAYVFVCDAHPVAMRGTLFVT